MVGAELLLIRRPEHRQGPAQVSQLRVELLCAVLPLTGHDLSEALPPLPLLGGIGRDQLLPAETPGAPRGEQFRQGRAQTCGFHRVDAQVKGPRRLAQADKDLEELGRAQGFTGITQQRQG